MKEEKFPEIIVNGEWSPICGHWFWDNNHGASLFCQKLNSKYTSGTVKKRRDIPLKKNGIRIGLCRSNDTNLLFCTGGKNDLSTNAYNCVAGEKSSVEIECNLGGQKSSVDIEINGGKEPRFRYYK